MTTEDTEDTEAVNDPNHHMNAALEAVAEVARKLKQERDEARERAERYRLEANAMMMQRDELQNSIVGWENKWKCAIEMAARAELERDEAIETLREIAAADWKTSGELRGMARKALEAVK